MDYPAGTERLRHLQGEGGIDIGSYWRRILFATKWAIRKTLLSKTYKRKRVLLTGIFAKDVDHCAFFVDSDPHLVISQAGFFGLRSLYGHRPISGFASTSGGINYIRPPSRYHRCLPPAVHILVDERRTRYQELCAFSGDFKRWVRCPQMNSHGNPEDFRVQT